jgi:deoxyribodipyrimidine photolyase
MGRKKKEVMESQGKRYMLFIFGDFTENETFINDISYQLVTVISSEYLKFNYGEYGMTLHFRTTESFEDLKEYVDMCLEDLVEQYFLMEATENVDIKMDRKLKKDFLNIDGVKIENKNKEIDVEKLNEEKKNKIGGMMDFLIPLSEDMINFPMTFKRPPVSEPTVDQILEKITEKGIESLTKEEKQILDNYAKRQNGGN